MLWSVPPRVCDPLYLVLSPDLRTLLYTGCVCDTDVKPGFIYPRVKNIYTVMPSLEISLRLSVASGAGPRAVGTERGRWSNW